MGEKNAAAAGDITEARFQDTGYSYTLSLIQGKHKMAILYCLVEYQPVRFNEMCRYLGGIASKALSANLKELERDGLVARREYPQIPPARGVLAHVVGGLAHGGARRPLRLGRGAHAAQMRTARADRDN